MFFSLYANNLVLSADNIASYYVKFVAHMMILLP